MKEGTNSLVIFERAAVMLAEANTIQKAKELKSYLLSAAEWARRKGMGEKAIQYCRSYALDAERKMGEMLSSVNLRNGARGIGSNQHKKVKVGLPEVTPPTLADFGLTKRDSSEAQQLANLPLETFELIRDGKKTRKEVKREIRREEHKKRVKAAQLKASKSTTPTNEPPGLVLADPPWRYEHCEAPDREIENHYNTETLGEIFNHSPKTLPDCILLLWATAPKLDEALQVMKAWGFNYRSCAVWDKEMMGMGYWFRIQHELLLVGVKGKPGCTPECERISSMIKSPRRKHSQKPDCVYEWIERAFPLIPKLEMYCRSPRKGWATCGNEC